MSNLTGSRETEGDMKQRVLSLLKAAPGTYISGEEISQVLGITRSAVWKHMEHLREEGYVIDSVSRKGYKILSAPDLLYPAEILEGLDTKVFGRKIHHFHEVDSTNNFAKKLAEEGAPEGTVVLAEEQIGGRGRLERAWQAPPGGIWMTAVLRPDIQPYLAPSLTLVAAVAVVQAVKAVTGLDLLIKWPNDVYLEGGKVCGILTEMKAEMDKVHYIVIGIGLNVNIDLAEFQKAAPDAGSLSAVLHRPVDRKKMTRELLSRLEDNYLIFCREGMDPLLEEWRKHNFTLGRTVVLKQGDRVFTGMAEDITPEGALLLRDEQGNTRPFYSGEVTVLKSKNR